MIASEPMHELALKAIVETVQKRNAEGDCPSVERPGPETLENAILDLADLSGLGVGPPSDSMIVTFRGYRVLCTISATFAQKACEFGDLTDLWKKERSDALCNWATRNGHSDPDSPLLWIGDIGSRKNRAGAYRYTFEIQLVIPEPHTAESLLRKLADELEPFGWGLCEFGRGAIAKEEQAEIQELLAARAAGQPAGKPLY